MATVLLVGGDDQLGAVGAALIQNGYRCHRAPAADAIARSEEVHPDVVVAYADGAGALAVEALRGDFRTRFVDVIVVADPTTLTDDIEELLAHADEYVFTTAAPDEVAARIAILQRRPHASRALNPVTGLAGKTLLIDEIAFRLKAHRHFAALYADLHDFNGYNRHYGFPRGDEAIKALGRTITVVLEDHPAPEHFAAHIGGDDFLVLTDRFIAQDIARDIVARFDAGAPELYDAADREQGFIEIVDRKGETQRLPLVSVSIGITVSGPREFHTYAELEHVAEEMNAVAKKEPGSSWALDRRRGPVS